MLTEYNGQIFNAEINGQKVSLWKYVPVNGFQKVTTGRGITYYEKTIAIEEIKEFFSVSFLAFFKNRRFVITSLNGNNLNVLCDDREYAEAHGFTEMEQGVWASRWSIGKFDSFQLIKSIENRNDRTVLNISKEQITDLWQRYVKEVNV